MKFPIRAPLLAGLSFCISLVGACSTTRDADPDVVVPVAADAADGSAAADAGPTSLADANASKPFGVDGGVVCTTRCNKAECADLEACIVRCEEQAAIIPASCDALVTAVDECVDAKGKWKCDNGEAKGNGPCAQEALTLLDCVIGRTRDGGLDAQADADAGDGL